MNYSKLDRNICRVCLEDNANLNWRDDLYESCGVSYRDCYYKYTQMEEIYEDFYPTNLCGKCADGVRNAHELFEKAVKSFIILQNTANLKDYETLNIESCSSLGESSFIETLKNEKTEIDIDEVICYSPLQDDNIAETEEEFSCKEISTSRCKNVHNFTSSCDPTIEQHALGRFDINLLTSIVDKEQIKKRRCLEALNTALELKLQLEISDKNILKSLLNGNATKNSKPSQNLLQNQQSNLLTLGKDQGNTTIQRVATTSVSNRQNEMVITHVSRVTADEVTPFKGEQSKRNTWLSSHISSNEKSAESIYSQQPNSTENLYKDELKSMTLNSPLSKPNLDDSDTTSFELSNPTCFLPAELEKAVKPSESDLPEQNLSENRVNPTALNTNDSYTDEAKILSETDDDKKTKSYKPLEIALLKKIYGNDFDIESMKQKNKPAKRSKGRVKICQYCSMVVYGKGKILLHEATHLQRERNEICPKCGLKFFTKDALNMHVKIHDENREKKHKCAYCEKAFYHSGARNVHQRIHLGLMVQCPMCPKQFFRQGDLEKHLPSHSVSKLNNGARRRKHKVHCQYCNKYIMTNSWKAHKAAHLKEPQVKCKICDREFYARDACVKHLRKKHGETVAYQQYIHALNNNRMSHLMIKQQEAVEMVIE